MSEINMNKDGFYGSGGGMGATPISGGGVGNSDVNWRLDQLVADMNIMWIKIAELETTRDNKSEPYDVMDSFRSSKIERDAGEPVNKYLTACLSKEQISDKLLFNKQREIEEIKQLAAEKQWALELAWSERDQYKGQLEAFKQSNESLRHQLNDRQRSNEIFREENDKLKNQMNAKQKVLEDVIDQRDRYLKQIYELSKQLETVKKDNEYSSGTLKNYEDRVAELDKENKSLKESIGNQKATITYLQSMNLHRVAKIDELEKANKYWEERVEKLQNENGDLRWGFDHPALVEYQTARECTEIVNRIKNDPLTVAVRDAKSKEWMVAICEDIEAAIKKEFNLNE